MHPKVEQKKTQAYQQEALYRIRRGRPFHGFVLQAVASLSAKSPSVLSPTLLGRPVKVDHYKQQPFSLFIELQVISFTKIA
jgi:hypothetical protein